MRIYSGLDLCGMQVLSTDVVALSECGMAIVHEGCNLVVNSGRNEFDSGWLFIGADQRGHMLAPDTTIEIALQYLQTGKRR